MASFRIKINGTWHAVVAPPATSLLDILRNYLGLTGTKEACGRGECGACTVLLDGRAICSCMIMVENAVGEVTTIEGLAAENTDLRGAFADCGALQCGYCTQGQIVRAAALLKEKWPDDPAGIVPYVRHAMSGNICRCTGYVGIVEAIVRVAHSRNERGLR